VALHVQDKFLVVGSELGARVLKARPASFGGSKNPPILPAAYAALKASSMLATPQAEVRNVPLE
jgi:hypothetical protein